MTRRRTLGSRKAKNRGPKKKSPSSTARKRRRTRQYKKKGGGDSTEKAIEDRISTMDEAGAKRKLVTLIQEMEQMKLMAHEIAVIKRSVRALKADNEQQLRLLKNCETEKANEKAACETEKKALEAQFLTIPCGFCGSHQNISHPLNRWPRMRVLH